MRAIVCRTWLIIQLSMPFKLCMFLELADSIHVGLGVIVLHRDPKQTRDLILLGENAVR